MALAIGIREAEYIPWGYGIAYRDFDRDIKIAYPLGMHLLVRWLRDFRCWLMLVGRPGYREKIEHGAYVRGVQREVERHQRTADDSYNRGYQAGIAFERQDTLTRFDAYIEQRRKERT